MCHPGLPPLPPGCAVRRRERQPGVSASPTAALPPRPHQAQTHYHCVCSPTTHPGSFRCRWHRAGYQWGRRRPFAAEGVVTPARAVGEPSAMRAGMAAP